MLVVAGAGGIHINDFEDILDATDNWVEVTSGLVAGKGPLSITSVGPSHTWMGATGGYIYFTDDPRGGVSVQDAGVATTQDLEAIHALDKLNVVAVGDLNAVIYTTNGGSTWQSLPGPAVGGNPTAAGMDDARLWLGGGANGELGRASERGGH